MPSQHQLIAALADGDPTNPVLFQPLSPASRLRVQDWTRREGAILALRTGALEAKRLKADLADLQAEQSRVKAPDSDLAKVKTEIAERDELLKVERNLVTALNTELSELKTSLDKQDEQLEAEQSRIAALNSELTELKKESDKRDKRFKAEQNRRMALNNELAEKNSAIANLNSDIRRSTIILQHERMSAQKAFFGGIRATLSATQSTARARSALYLHYLIVRRRKDADNLALLAASGFFDPAYYLERNADVAEAGTDPLIHFIDLGAAQGRNPSSFFDTAYYLEHNADVAASRINPLLHFVSRGRSEGRSPKAPKRIVIYTAVTAGYDELKPPGFRPSNCDFVAFSDQPLKVDGWEVRPLNYLHQDPTRAARFVKLHPHIYFPDYDYSIWMDGNISIRRDARDIGMRGDIRTFLLSLGENDFLGIFIHPLRDCIYVEAEECIKRSKDDEEVISRHVERYRADGFPEKAGLWETNVLVRRHNDPSCIALMTAWWRELETGSRRDQLSLPVVAQRLSAKIAPLAQPGENARTHPLLNLTQHPSRRIAPVQATVPPVVRKDIDIDRISVDIGVCVHNSPNEVAACLTSLIAARRPQDSIFIVDDASDAPTATLLDQFANKYDRIKLIRHEQNEGYTRSANDVLKNTQSDWVVLLNSDTVVPSRALRKLITCGEQFSRIGIVGPLSNAASWQTVPQMTGPDKKFLVNQIPPPLTVEDMDGLCEQISTGTVLFVPLVNGFCYAIRRALIRRIGYFDEAHFPTGYGEEDDYCLRAGAAGYICGIATDTYVYHVKSASFTSERRALLAAAGGKALRRKHSADRVAAAADMMRHHPELRRIRERISRRLDTVTKQELIS
jgi:GT2 family glycosyltransferase/predicted  nucleic acid-binding Zn-ribbon protein